MAGETESEQDSSERQHRLNALVFDNTPPAEILVNPIISGLMWAAFGTPAARSAFATLFAATLLVVAVNGTIFRRQAKDPEKAARAMHWHRLLVAGAVLNGAVWGLGLAAVIVATDSPVTVLFAFLVLSGFCGGYVASQSASPPSVLGFMWTSALPVCLSLWLAPAAPPHALLLAVVFLAYAGLLSFFCRNSARTIRSAVDLQFENRALHREVARQAAALRDIGDSLPGVIYELRRDCAGRWSLPYASAGPGWIGGGSDPAGRLAAVASAIHPDDLMRVRRGLCRAAHDLATWNGNFRMLHPERGWIRVESRATPAQGSDGALVWRGFAHDATEQWLLEQRTRELIASREAERRAEELVAERTAALQRAREADVKFIDVISHEYRTPLSVLASNVAALESGLDAGDEMARKRLMRVKRAVGRLEDLLERMSERSREDGAGAQLRLQPCVPAELMARAVRRMHDVHGDYEIRLQPAAGLPGFAALDCDMAELALFNLLENAVKFSPERTPVTLAAEIVAGRLRFRVEDSGIGIPPGEAPRLAERHFRGSNAGGTPGTGMGLSLVAAVARAHGGSFSIAGRPGGGSSAVLDLPLVTPRQ